MMKGFKIMMVFEASAGFKELQQVLVKKCVLYNYHRRKFRDLRSRCTCIVTVVTVTWNTAVFDPHCMGRRFLNIAIIWDLQPFFICCLICPRIEDFKSAASVGGVTRHTLFPWHVYFLRAIYIGEVCFFFILMCDIPLFVHDMNVQIHNSLNTAVFIRQ